jgi:hypothetical protein
MKIPATTGNNVPGGVNDMSTLVRIIAVAGIVAGSSAAISMAFGGGGVEAATVAALLSLSGVAAGYGLGRKDGPTPKVIRMLMFRVADELAQYRAFTRLLRDQGIRITESTSEAATVIVTGLREMDARIGHLRALVGCADSDDAKELRSLLDSVGAPVVDMLGQLQFQDVTQQQIAFLSRLSLIVDQHMIDLARQLGDRRSMDRVGHFKEMFNKALDDCVMSSQREDHHIAAGLDLLEAGGPKIEMF